MTYKLMINDKEPHMIGSGEEIIENKLYRFYEVVVNVSNLRLALKITVHLRFHVFNYTE